MWFPYTNKIDNIPDDVHTLKNGSGMSNAFVEQLISYKASPSNSCAHEKQPVLVEMSCSKNHRSSNYEVAEFMDNKQLMSSDRHWLDDRARQPIVDRVTACTPEANTHHRVVSQINHKYTSNNHSSAINMKQQQQNSTSAGGQIVPSPIASNNAERFIRKLTRANTLASTARRPVVNCCNHQEDQSKMFPGSPSNERVWSETLSCIPVFDGSSTVSGQRIEFSNRGIADTIDKDLIRRKPPTGRLRQRTAGTTVSKACTRSPVQLRIAGSNSALMLPSAVSYRDYSLHNVTSVVDQLPDNIAIRPLPIRPNHNTKLPTNFRSLPVTLPATIASGSYVRTSDSALATRQEVSLPKQKASTASDRSSSSFPDDDCSDSSQNITEKSLSAVQPRGRSNSTLNRCRRCMSDLSLDDNVSLANTSASSLRSESIASTTSHMSNDIRRHEQLKGFSKPLTESLFSNVPPTIKFVSSDRQIEQLPRKYRQLLRWKMSTLTPNVVKACILRSGFRITKKEHAWIGYWGAHMKADEFRLLKEYQKFNHFPGSFQLGRKDRLLRNLSRLHSQFGSDDFGFFPQTFVLPADLANLKASWDDENPKQKWIIKPPASARGIGIRVIHKWKEIPKRRPVLVQQYLSRPYLINGSKFDLRIYVHVTCFDPLRIYIYKDGLVRFASTRYSYSTKNLSNRFIHLTNYSINKHNDKYKSGNQVNVSQAHKWCVSAVANCKNVHVFTLRSLMALWDYLRQLDVNTEYIWSKIVDIVLKTIISADTYINSMIVSNIRRRYCCHELFGFDILLDETLKPWLIEVNVSPSLHSNSELDVQVKSALVCDALNLVGYVLPDREDIMPGPSPPVDMSTYKPSSELCIDRRLWPSQKSIDERAKHLFYIQHRNDAQVQSTILDVLTPDDIRILVETCDENNRRGNFERIFPSADSQQYLQYFEQPRYYSLLLNQWVRKFPDNTSQGVLLLESFCAEGIHLQHQTQHPSHQWSSPALASESNAPKSAKFAKSLSSSSSAAAM